MHEALALIPSTTKKIIDSLLSILMNNCSQETLQGIVVLSSKEAVTALWGFV